MSEEREPIDTSTPWHRPRREPLTQVEYERQAYRAMTTPGKGNIHPGSITTPTYEPNRAMAPEPSSIIGKKGVRDNTPDAVTIGDRIVHAVVGICILGIFGILGYMLIKLG
jgi:hypothetical protein